MYTDTQDPPVPEEGLVFTVTRVTGDCEQPRRCRQLNLGFLQEQFVLLALESSLQPLRIVFFFKELFNYYFMFCISTLIKLWEENLNNM